MGKMTNHAIERLHERYNIISEMDVSYLETVFFIDEHYILVSELNDGLESRQVKFKKRNIQAVVNPKNGIIVSFIPETIIPEPIDPIFKRSEEKRFQLENEINKRALKLAEKLISDKFNILSCRMGELQRLLIELKDTNKPKLKDLFKRRNHDKQTNNRR